MIINTNILEICDMFWTELNGKKVLFLFISRENKGNWRQNYDKINKYDSSVSFNVWYEKKKSNNK